MSEYKLVGCENPRTGEESVWVARDRKSMSPEDIVDDLNSMQADLAACRKELVALRRAAVDLVKCVDPEDVARIVDLHPVLEADA